MNELARAVELLRAGEIIAYPTEAVFGLGVDPHNQTAIQKLLAIKHRHSAQGLIVVAANLEQLDDWIDAAYIARHFPQIQATAIHQRAVTWCVPCRETCNPFLTGTHPTLAIRISAHPQIIALCNAFAGGIVSTSANPHGLSPARDYQSAKAYFPDIFCLHGQTIQSAPSMIKIAATGALLRS